MLNGCKIGKTSSEKTDYLWKDLILEIVETF